ncbi:MAG: chorismate mutase, partial [Sulfuricurvum sp.]|nr:chorismate mutase [Sulfuricurvum sp.]
MNVEECHSLAEVRQYIDTLDDQIVELIAARNGYIKQAANFKHS